MLGLADHFLASHARAHGIAPKRLDEDARRWLLAYDWPGNVRELSHLMERVTLLVPATDVGREVIERLRMPLAPPSAPEPPAVTDDEATAHPRGARALGRQRGAGGATPRHRTERAPPPHAASRHRAPRPGGLRSAASRELARRVAAPDRIPADVGAEAGRPPGDRSRAARADAYEPWTLARRWETRIEERVAGFEGTILARAPSRLTAVFGIPRALEQLPQRAVLAALAIQQLLAASRPHEERDPSPELRIAVHLGAVHVDISAPTAPPRLLPIGDTLALAERLLGHAGSGESWCRRRLRGASSRGASCERATCASGNPHAARVRRRRAAAGAGGSSGRRSRAESVRRARAGAHAASRELRERRRRERAGRLHGRRSRPRQVPAPGGVSPGPGRHAAQLGRGTVRILRYHDGIPADRRRPAADVGHRRPGRRGERGREGRCRHRGARRRSRHGRCRSCARCSASRREMPRSPRSTRRAGGASLPRHEGDHPAGRGASAARRRGGGSALDRSGVRGVPRLHCRRRADDARLARVLAPSRLPASLRRSQLPRPGDAAAAVVGRDGRHHRRAARDRGGPGARPLAHRRQGGGQPVLRRGGDALAARGRHAAARERARGAGARHRGRSPCRTRIQDVLGARMDRLADDARRAIQVASVIGREFALRLLERITEAGVARAHARGGAARARAHLREGDASRARLHVQACAHPRRGLRERPARPPPRAARHHRPRHRGALRRPVGRVLRDARPPFRPRARRGSERSHYHERAAGKAAESFANRAVVAHCRQALAIAERLGAAVPDERHRRLEEQLGARLAST